MSIAKWTSPIGELYRDKATMGVRDGCATPARYTAVADEHRSLRSGIGIVDYSHYGKLQLTGPGALELANRVALVDVLRLPINKMVPSFILNEDASVFCEVYVVNRGDHYLLLTEGREPDELLATLMGVREAVEAPVEIADLTRSQALIGLDGPYSWELAKEFFGMRILGVRYLDIVPNQLLEDVPVTIYRGGKTGEFGYWLQVDAEQAVKVWTLLLEAGKEFDMLPSGFEAVDLCKLENRFINMQREGAMAAHVLELNTRAMVDREKEDYRGRPAVLEGAVERRLIGLEIESEAVVPAVGAEVSHLGRPIGAVANSAFSYTLNKPIAVALMNRDYAYVGLDYEIATTEDAYRVRTVSAPFIFNQSLSVRPQEHSYFDRA